MTYLLAGVLIWSLVHLIRCIAPSFRETMIGKLGENGWKGLFAHLILAALGLMIFGWRSADPVSVYQPAAWGRPVGMAVVLLGFVFFGAAQGQTNIKRLVRHPQLTGVLLWSVGHLLANGDNLSVLLFTGLGVWASLEIILISLREGEWQKPDAVPTSRDIRNVAISVVIFGVAYAAHEWLSGVPLIAF